MRIQNQELTITQEKIDELNKAVAGATMSKGAAIRECFAGGMSIKEISKATGILYNHCYNVANQEVLKHGLEVEKSGRDSGNTKKAQILQLREEGKSLAEISKELGCLYNQVWQVCNKAGLTDKQLNVDPSSDVETESAEVKSA